MKKSGYFLATMAGLLSTILWASNIAFSKSAMNKEGNLNAAFYIYFFSGIATFLVLLILQKEIGFFKRLRNLPFSYYLKTGIFFILNNVLLFIAIGLTRNNEELIIVTLLNYSWPIMIYILGIPLHKLKIPLKTLLPGIILSFLGISLALLQGYTSEIVGKIIRAGDDNLIAYFLAFMTSVSWAIYSNLTSKYKTEDDIAGIPIIFLISGLIFLLITAIKGQLTTVHLSGIFQNPDLLYLIAGPTSLGYLFWYFAMKKGNKYLVTSISFFIPLFSILIISFKFHTEIRFFFWLSAMMLITGSYLCYKSFQDSLIINEKNVANPEG
jgi:drug/metabolite transporter (DMT)-like permease